MKVYEEIPVELAEWISAQPLYFVASSPLSEQGHINLSPRGLDSLRMINSREVALLDLTGSGNETAAHLSENGRITIMLCAFSASPAIVRLFGKGSVVRPGAANWDSLFARFDQSVIKSSPGIRQIFHVQLNRVQTSCGFGVPMMDFTGQRSELLDWAKKKGENGIHQYQMSNNTRSIDGLPAPLFTPGIEQTN